MNLSNQLISLIPSAIGKKSFILSSIRPSLKNNLVNVVLLAKSKLSKLVLLTNSIGCKVSLPRLKNEISNGYPSEYLA